MKSLMINEVKFLIRQPLLWLAFILMPLFAFILAVGTGSLSDIPLKQMQITSMGLLMVAVPFSFAVLSPVIYLRDNLSGMFELVSVTPVSTLKRLTVRWLMLVLAQASLLVVCNGVFVVHTVLQYGFDGAFVRFALFHLVFLSLPAILFLSSLALWLSKAFSSAIVIYVVFVLFWFVYVTLGSMTGSPILAGSSVVNEVLVQVMQVVDPYGVTELMVGIQKTGKLELFTPSLMTNRLGWLFIAALLFVFSLKTKPLGWRLNSKRSNQQNQASSLVSARTNEGMTKYFRASQSVHSLRQLRHLIVTDLRGLLSNRLNILLLIGWPMLVFSEVMSGVNYAESFSVFEPSSIDALNRIGWDTLPGVGCLFMVLFSWQICWRNKSSDMAELVSASPVKSSVLVSSHMISLLLSLFLIVLLAAVGTLTVELIVESQIIPLQYLKQLSFNMFSLALLAIVFVAIHTGVHLRAVAMLMISLVLAAKFLPLMQILGLTHPFWDIFTIPLAIPDSLWGYSGSISTLLPYGSFWLLVAVVLFGLSVPLSHRTSGLNTINWDTLIYLPKSNLVSVLLMFVSGFVLYQGISSQVPLVTAKQSIEWRVDYEKAYSEWKQKPQPKITKIDSVVDIYPNQGAAKFEMSLTLTNETTVPMEQVLVGGWGNTSFDSVVLEGAELAYFDEALNQHVFIMKKVLQPHQSAKLVVKFVYQQPSLLAAGSHQMIKPTYTYLRSVPIVPYIGFNDNIRIRNGDTRAKYELPVLENVLPSQRFANTNHREGDYDFVQMKTVISTTAEQYAVTQGELVNEWRQGQRRYFEYATLNPIRNIPAWLSLPIEPYEKQYHDVYLKIFTPEPETSTEVHWHAMQDTIDWFSEHVYPYKGQQLSLTTFPNIGPTGYALPQLVLLNTRVGFRTKPSDDAGFDQRYRRTVHETAHQWFGHTLGNGVSNDRSFLIESMAKYSELVMIDRRYGKEAVDALVDYELGRYRVTQARTSRPVQALVDAESSHDVYSRATIVFAKLRKTIGDDAIIATLKQLFAVHAYPMNPATSMDFVRVLKDHTQQAHHQLIDKLLTSKDISMLLQ
jgi:hypothetical protein